MDEKNAGRECPQRLTPDRQNQIDAHALETADGGRAMFTEAERIVFLEALRDYLETPEGTALIRCALDEPGARTDEDGGEP